MLLVRPQFSQWNRNESRDRHACVLHNSGVPNYNCTGLYSTDVVFQKQYIDSYFYKGMSTQFRNVLFFPK